MLSYFSLLTTVVFALTDLKKRELLNSRRMLCSVCVYHDHAAETELFILDAFIYH